MFGAFCDFRQGAGHRADGRPCQDFAGMRLLPRFAVIAVADAALPFSKMWDRDQKLLEERRAAYKGE